MQRLVYHLIVQSDGLVRIEFTGVGRDDRRESPLDLAQLPHAQAHLADLLQQGQQTRPKLERTGRYLYDLLFTGAVRAHFAEVVWPLLAADPTRRRLVITLTFQESNLYPVRETAALPWEFLYCPHNGGVFLATDPRCTVARRDRAYPPGMDALHDARGLRVLLAHLQPEDAPPVSLTRIRNVLRELSEEQTAARPLTPVLVQNPTPAQLTVNLEKIQPHVLHLLLHGRFAPDSTRFGFVDDRGHTRWYGDRSLTDLFAQQQPRLVIVQACEGGRLDDARALAHGANRLLLAGVPAVVAMQYPITNQVGWEFAEVLYRELAGGAAVDTAVQAGRRHLAQYDTSLPDDHASRDFGAVVLWQRPVLIAPIEEKKRMTQTVIVITPDGEQYAAEVTPDTLVAELVRDFVGQWSPSPAYSTRYTLRQGAREQAPLDTAVTLAEAGVPDGARLWLVAERLLPDDPVGLTIEDDEGGRFATAVLLSTRLQELVDAFLAHRPARAGRQPSVALVTGVTEAATERPLSPQVTLHEAGISHDALLRIKTVPL